MTPSGRLMVLIWALAIGLVASVSALAWVAGHRQIQSQMTGYDTLLIGTSLIGYAVPNTPDSQAAQPFGPDRYLRLGVASASEAQILDLARAAVAAKPKSLFIEINPLISRFAFATAGCGPEYRLQAVAEFVKRATKTTLRGRNLLERATQNPPLAAASQTDPAVMARNYPLKFPPLCYGLQWQTLAQTAQDTQIVLVVMPRSAQARALIGADDMTRFHRAALDLAARLQLPLFVPDAANAWPDSYFKDQAHMNAQGSAAFLTALAAWRKAEPR